MNYPGVISADRDVVRKLEAAQRANKIIDGHAPAVSGNALNAYLCGGISTDHECVEGSEIEEKISKGMYVHIRHGSSTQNLGNAKYITPANMRRFILCTDDRHAADLRKRDILTTPCASLLRTDLTPFGL
jgi:adenine deaminase